MAEGSANHVANHMLESILRDLSFLKDNNFIPNQIYKDVVNILPSRIQETTTTTTTDSNRPPLPTRKSTMTPPKTNSREVVSSFPKLPVRRSPTNDWQQPQPPMVQSVAMAQPVAMAPPPPMIQEEKAVHVTPPPAYTQKPAIESLITVEALYDYHGEDPSTDLSFKQGNIIEVTEYVNDDWWKGTVNGKSGIFPQNHVKKVAPSIKPKRPWVPPTSAKPSFSTSSNTSSYSQSSTPSYSQSTTQPYSYPPPPTAMYQPPPQLPNQQSYGQPPVQSYGQPPVHGQAPAAAPTEEEGGDKKVQNMAKKFGGHVATAATWGFGATLGSQAANAIF